MVYSRPLLPFRQFTGNYICREIRHKYDCVGSVFPAEYPALLSDVIGCPAKLPCIMGILKKGLTSWRSKNLDYCTKFMF